MDPNFFQRNQPWDYFPLTPTDFYQLLIAVLGTLLTVCGYSLKKGGDRMTKLEGRVDALNETKADKTALEDAIELAEENTRSLHELRLIVTRLVTLEEVKEKNHE